MPYSFLDLAEDVLKKSDKPLTYQEMWDAAKADQLTGKVGSLGKTPWQTLGARLYVEVRDNPHSQFIKVGRRPARFFLKHREKELSSDVIAKIEIEETRTREPQTTYRERDLHPLVAYFCSANPSFNRGRSIYTKTIHHEKSARKGFSEWVHPDMVGFYLPIDDWRPEVIEFNRLSDNNSLRLFSFELKKGLNKANYRESYFQAVSNSSWAHEGYLVAPHILQDDEFLAELQRLSASFGIGVIQLDLQDIDASTVLYWEMINKLCDHNTDFHKFIQDVRIDFESKRVHKTEYDEILKDPKQYIADKMKILQAG